MALPLRTEPAPLCRADGHTCAACCYGEALPRAVLERRLRRHTALFDRCVGGQPARGRLLGFELLAHGATGLIWAVLLLIPGLGGLVRPWWKRRTVCAFLGFVDESQTQVGCLLHPERHGGRDFRMQAFALWLGLGCGPADWFCLPAWRYARGGWRGQRDLLRAAEGLDWYAFGQLVSSHRRDRM